MKKTQPKKKKVLLVSLLSLMTLGLSLGSVYLLTKNDKKTSPDEIVGNVGTTIENKNMDLKLLSTDLDSKTGYVTKTFTYVIKPYNADDLSVTTKAYFIESKKTCDEYIDVTSNTSKQEITLVCKKAFNEKIILEIIANGNSNAKSFITLDYQDHISNTYSEIDFTSLNKDVVYFDDMLPTIDAQTTHTGGTLEKDYFDHEQNDLVGYDFDLEFQDNPLFDNEIGQIMKYSIEDITSKIAFNTKIRDCFFYVDENSHMVMVSEDIAKDRLFNLLGISYDESNYTECILWKNYSKMHSNLSNHKENAKQMNIYVEMWHGILKNTNEIFNDTVALKYDIYSVYSGHIPLDLINTYTLTKDDYKDYTSLPIDVLSNSTNIIF